MKETLGSNRFGGKTFSWLLSPRTMGTAQKYMLPLNGGKKTFKERMLSSPFMSLKKAFVFPSVIKSQ